MAKNYSFELHEFRPSQNPYGTMETSSPSMTVLSVDDFTEGKHFRTAAEPDTKSLALHLNDRVMSVVLDESGSMTWNDYNNDRYTFLKRMLTKLDQTYPGKIKGNLIGFGGSLAKTQLFIAPGSSNFLTSSNQNFNQFLKSSFQDSVYDFAGVRVVRRTDRYPIHPADGVVVAEGIMEAVKDDDLQEGQTYYYGIWTYNKQFHYGTGRFIKSTPKDRILPRGVNYASGISRELPGIRRDEHTEIIYNFAEKSGSLVLDSSGNNRHGTLGTEVIEDSFWAGDYSVPYEGSTEEKKPAGVRFDGRYDLLETTINDNLSFVATGESGVQALTVNFWVFRYASTEDVWVIGTSRQNASNEIGWAIGIKANGNLGYKFNDLSTGFVEAISTVGDKYFIPERQWTMVTVSMSVYITASFGYPILEVYIDGQTTVNTVSISTLNLPSVGYDSLYIGAKPVDSGSAWPGVDFFGSLGQISISSIRRDASYIADLYSQELQVFEQTWREDTKPDNFQREVLLSWNIGQDYDFDGGQIKVVRKYKGVPYDLEDGELVTTIDPEPGEYYYLDSYPFIHNADYNYRIFTVNSLGNVCDLSEARVISVNIPASTTAPDASVSPVTNASIITGSQKVFIQWQNPTSSSWRGTQVFVSTRGYPHVVRGSDGGVQTTGAIATDTTGSSFTHRIQGRNNGVEIPLTNGAQYYYTIVAYDEYGRYSDPVYITGVPSSQIDTTFVPESVQNLNIMVLNPKTLSIQWLNPTIRSAKLDLWMGEQAICFVNVRDIYGGGLEDITNLNLLVNTSFDKRIDETDEKPLSATGGIPASYTGAGVDEGPTGAQIEPNKPGTMEHDETVIHFATIQSGLIKGLLTHTADRDILEGRKSYSMSVWARYVSTVDGTSDGSKTFEFNTKAVQVSFHHPIAISMVNKMNRKIRYVGSKDEITGDEQCPCDKEPTPETSYINGSYVGSNYPYVCRVEIQYKGESIPAGTPVWIELFKSGTNFRIKSTKTFIREGNYATIPILEDELDGDKEPTGRKISKSYVDIEIQSPTEPDDVDILAIFQFAGFRVKAKHTTRWLPTLHLSTIISPPNPDGIDVAEQFAMAWLVDPDDPENPAKNRPVPDGTLIKWEMTPGKYGKQRPFYGTENLGRNLIGVYSSTTGGQARNVFFGPIGKMENHFFTINCGEGEIIDCCVSENYTIRASIIYQGESRFHGKAFFYRCDKKKFTDKRFLMNAASETPGTSPHYFTWADGVHLLKFQIAKNPATSTIRGAECFRDCVEATIGGQLFPLEDGQIVQISADAEILWDVTFADEPAKSGEEGSPGSALTKEPIAFQSAIPGDVANIPIRGETTDFYLRLNRFLGDGMFPQPDKCENKNSLSSVLNNALNPCQWEGVCNGVSACNAQGQKWINVTSLSGTTSLIFQNKEVFLTSGGDYDNGIPPIYYGWREPLSLRVIEARVNGARVEELVTDRSAIHTFVVEVTFAGQPVPDGTSIDLTVDNDEQKVILFSSCSAAQEICHPTSSRKIYTRLVNDPLINPTGNPRSFAYFSLDPLPNVNFSAEIGLSCRYDKLKTADRLVKKCIVLNNPVKSNISEEIDEIPDDGQPIEPPPAPVSNGLLVYDTVTDEYRITTAGKVRRMAHMSVAMPGLSGSADLTSGYSGVSDRIYVFGGHTGSTTNNSPDLTPRCEYFDVIEEDWDYIPDMPTARAAGMAIAVGRRIYVIGGIEQDPMVDSSYRVSRKVEYYDTVTNLWNESLTDIPENYGVAFGAIYHEGDYIYITSGIKTLENSSQAGDLNDRILRYSISAEEEGLQPWTVLTPSNPELYRRIAPFYFNRNGDFYVYGGSISKSLTQISSEQQEEINRRLANFRSDALSSTYVQSLTKEEQEIFINSNEESIRNAVQTTPFVYPLTGYRFSSEDVVGSDVSIDQFLDNEWSVLPSPRDRGCAVYVPNQDAVYFIGGANQNKSTTLNRVERIIFQSDNAYARMTDLNQGRSLFSSSIIGDDIYIYGGLNSGHRPGWVQISVDASPEYVEARGIQSAGLLVTIKDDSGELIPDNVRCAVRGYLRIPRIDDIVTEYLASRAADRALGGTGKGDAPDLPNEGEKLDVNRLAKAQNTIIDPNSDQFQYNANRKLSEQIYLFPVLYSKQEINIVKGYGGVSLLPRSEDPLDEVERLGVFIKEILTNIPPETDERFVGDLTREELAALGDVLSTVKIDPTVIESGVARELYTIETQITVLDDHWYGQTVSEYDLNVQQEIKQKIIKKLTPPKDTSDGSGSGSGSGSDFDFWGGSESGSTGGPGSGPEERCFKLQRLNKPDITTAGDGTNNDSRDKSPPYPGGTNAASQSGQCQFCNTLLPLAPSVRNQLVPQSVKFFQVVDWLPQIRRYFVGNDTDLSDIASQLDVMDHEIPFGGSQLYDALYASGTLLGSEDVDVLPKSIYVCSDNDQNLSLVTRDAAIEEINAVSGDKKTPVVYIVFSTSFPQSLSAKLDRSQVGDVAKITKMTGGQSATLLSSDFLSQTLNMAIGSAIGGLGFGIYRRTINFGELSAVTSVTTDFELPSNTAGSIKYRYSQDGYNFSSWSDIYEGSQTIDFEDFFAKVVEIQVTLSTGFTTTIDDDVTATSGSPKLKSIMWDISAEKEDYLYLNKEDILTNAQQVAVAFEGYVPTNGLVEIGVSTSESHDWKDFHSAAQPSVREYGKIFLLDRTGDGNSVVPTENLQTDDFIRYRTQYGSWNPAATARLYLVENNVETPVLSGFRMFPRTGEVFFDSRQDRNAVLRLKIINKGEMRVGLRLRNRLHNDSVRIEGTGYLFSTNNTRPSELSQVAPKAVNVMITPDTPKVNDTIFALYDYVDLNNDPETGSIISWYKNGSQLLEIQNRSSFTKSDLLPKNALQPGDQITFAVTPSDGRDFGTTVFSPSVQIAASPPGAYSVKIVPRRNSVINGRYDTSSVFTIQYDFQTDDTGSAGFEVGTEIKWYVNGVLFKEGVYSAVESDPYFDPKILSPGESSLGTMSHTIGNQIYAEITPKTIMIVGETVRTKTIIVENSVPEAKNVTVSPLVPTTATALSLTYSIDDYDVEVSRTQTDQSEIRWFMSPNGTKYSEMTNLRKQRSVPVSNLANGQYWYAEVTPDDGLDLGPIARSNTVKIGA